MNRFLHFVMLILSPLIMNASGDTLITESSPIKRWNITASIGYGFPFSKQVLGSEATVDRYSNIEGKLIRGTFGKGIFSFVSAGYKINSHLGAEFGLHSTWGKKIMTHQLTNLYYPSVSQTFFQVSTNGMFAGFFMTDTYSKFHISLHSDLLVGIINQATEESFSGSIQNPTWEYSGGISYGWLNRFGGSYDVSERINVGLNGFFVMHNWSPSQKQTTNGQNKITFTDNTTFNGVGPNQSSPLPRVTYPLHAAGVNLFIAYNF